MILGLDIATTTGWALATGRHQFKATGSFSGKADTMYQSKRKLELAMHRVLKENGIPKFCIIESPMLMPRNPKTSAVLHFYAGAVSAVVGGYGVPIEWVDESTWRAKMYGRARVKGWGSKEWKAHARQTCEDVFKIDVRNSDEAEAAVIAQYGFFSQRYRAMTDAALQKQLA